jgi:2',3'-cyclic-nucleotide 2'-phosphodiesterase (5'-nucleotidase family)
VEGELTGKTVGGFDRLAAAVKSIRQNAEHVLLLDAGDAIAGSMISKETRGEAVIKLMNSVGYDAMAIGNHEFDFGEERLSALIGRARFPVLAANIRVKSTGGLFTRPYIIRQLGPLKIGILGMAYPNTTLTTAQNNVINLEFEDAAPVANRFIRQMRDEGATIVIVLSHLGLGADVQLAKAVPGIDVIVGGHSHNRMAEAKRVGDTLIAQAGAHGSDLGVLELTFEGARRAGSTDHLVTMDHALIEADSDVTAELAGLTAPLLPKNAPVGQGGDWLIRAQTLTGAEPRLRNQESPVDALFADIIRKSANVDVAFLPGVGYGVGIPPGSISTAELINLIPHESYIFIMEMNGAQLLEILEQSIENVYTGDPAEKVGGMIQVSGLAFTYDPQGRPGAHVGSALVNSLPLDTRERYRVATNSLLAEGGHNYRTFRTIRDRSDLGSQFEMIKNWLRVHPGITTPPAGRIKQTGH